jgi:hypothetical protein
LFAILASRAVIRDFLLRREQDQAFVIRSRLISNSAVSISQRAKRGCSTS